MSKVFNTDFFSLCSRRCLDLYYLFKNKIVCVCVCVCTRIRLFFFKKRFGPFGKDEEVKTRKGD